MPNDNGYAEALQGYDGERRAKRSKTRAECDGKGLAVRDAPLDGRQPKEDIKAT
jgi:hypothetical protein